MKGNIYSQAESFFSNSLFPCQLINDRNLNSPVRLSVFQFNLIESLYLYTKNSVTLPYSLYMKYLFFFILIAVFNSMALQTSIVTMTSKNIQTTARIHFILDSIYQKHPETRGMSIHIEAPKHRISWNGGIGFADTKGKILTSQMPANIASNTKTFIAVAILRLVELKKITISDPIATVISQKSNALLLKAGYNTQEIKVKHLLTNTSGIFDFVNTQQFQNLTQSNPKYRWTRDEQIELAVQFGTANIKAGEIFAYSETNYSLLTEIIEQKTQQPFHIAVRNLLKFDALKLHNTWFLLQEPYPKHTLPLVEQTAKTLNVNSYSLDYSFDAFGGGGLASTVSDLAKFFHYLFNDSIFENPVTKQMLYTTVSTSDGLTPTYSFGLMHTNVGRYKAYGHGGFWGTQVKYIPELNLSIAAFVMERDTWPIYNLLIEEVVKELEKQY